MSQQVKNRLLVVFLIVMGVALLYAYRPPQSSPPAVPPSFSELAAQIKEGKITELKVTTDGNVEVKTSEDKTFTVFVGSAFEQGEVLQRFRNLGVTEEQLAKVKINFASPPPAWMGAVGSTLLMLLPLLLIGGLFIFMMRGAQGQNNQAMNFGQSRAKLVIPGRSTKTFDDVAGCDEAKQELIEVVEFLKEPDKFREVGARIPRGVLLIGPPGCGKTLLAKAVAGEAKASFFSISGSEFVEMFVGVGAARVRDLFSKAKASAPAILFIDEIDAIGRSRGTGIGGSHDEREQTLNQILVEMDGFDTNTNVIVMAATNRPDVLDAALVRPGRFDRRVVVDPPDIRGRELVFGIHVRGKPVAEDIQLVKLARATPGFSGADIDNAVNEAAIYAALRKKERGGKKVITMQDFRDAIEKVSLGPERKSRVFSKAVKRIIAFHETGHAVVMTKTPLSDPVQKVSVISRGMALGYTMPLPEEDRHLLSRGQIKAQIDGLMGGRVAEELFLGNVDDITTGASNDLEKASELARRMVTKWGMSEKLGPRVFDNRSEMDFLGRGIQDGFDYSDEVAHRIDTAIDSILGEAKERAKKLLEENREIVERIVDELLKKETLDAEEFSSLVNGTPLSAK